MVLRINGSCGFNLKLQSHQTFSVLNICINEAISSFKARLLFHFILANLLPTPDPNTGVHMQSQVWTENRKINFTTGGFSPLPDTPNCFDSFGDAFGSSGFDICFPISTHPQLVCIKLMKELMGGNIWVLLNKSLFTITISEMAERGSGSYLKAYDYLNTKQIQREKQFRKVQKKIIYTRRQWRMQGYTCLWRYAAPLVSEFQCFPSRWADGEK